ncbi:hypothetical protein ACFV4P_31225 [Kitasatospora sp. NPDC059795]|uniref:hypothetical protein n=1 Tax=Kitasatospora sp. NPDC059795 TaxID=3346949 RepID=UPI00365C42E2
MPEPTDRQKELLALASKLEAAAESWPFSRTMEPFALPSTVLVAEQLAVLSHLHTEAVGAAARPLEPLTTPDEAAGREAEARAAGHVAIGIQDLTAVLGLAVAAENRNEAPKAAHLHRAGGHYLAASARLHGAAQDLRLHAEHVPGHSPAPRRRPGAVRRAAARLRSAVRPNTAAGILPAPPAAPPNVSPPSRTR